ncbi:MAG: acyl-CoA dehydrogenase [Gammaproteobacteria bacterium]
MLVFLLGFIVILTALAYVKVSLKSWTFAIVVFLFLSPALFSVSSWVLILFWLLSLAILIPLNIGSIRKQYLTKPALDLFRNVLPPLSSTEKEAMESGDIWWDGDLFSGDPDWNKLLSNPKPTLSEEEQIFLDGPVEILCNMIDDWQVTHIEKDLPKEIWDYLRKEKFFGMIIAKEHGGLGFTALGHSSVVMKISTRSITAAVTVMVPNSLGPGSLLQTYGTQKQKDYYLPRLSSGEEFPCFALTGPDAGSDAGAMPDFGIVCRQDFNGEKDVLGVRITWEKRYITLGPVATILGLAFKLYDPEHLIGEKENVGITLALIPTDHEGVSIGRRHIPVDIPFQNGPNSGEDVFIPIDWLIGGQEYVGKGWSMLMECLAEGRGVSLPALSAGAAKLASRTSGAYSVVRKQFNMSISKFEGVQESLGRIAGLSYMIESARTMTLGALDQHIHPSVVTAIIKYHLTESMRTLIDDAMDIHGGKGIMMGPGNYLGRIYQSIPVSITVEGANILTRNMMIYGQGATRCHPYVLKEMLAASEENDAIALGKFDDVFYKHLAFTISNKARAFVLGLTNGYFGSTPNNGAGRRYYQQLSRMSAALAFTSDVAMIVLGGELKRREYMSARLGDVLSYLYLGSAILKRFEDQGRLEDDEPLMQWASEYCLFRMQESFYGLFENFPNCLFGKSLRLIVFPWGRSFKKPSDKLTSKAAAILTTPSKARDRLTEDLFIPQDENESVSQLEKALELMIKSQPVEKKIYQARRAGQLNPEPGELLYKTALTAGIITAEEAQVMEAATKAQRNVIMVDDFDPEEV